MLLRWYLGSGGEFSGSVKAVLRQCLSVVVVIFRQC